MSIVNLEMRLAEVERKLSVSMVMGTVQERDRSKGIRVKIAESDDGPVLSNWIRTSDHNAGLRTSITPRQGAQVMLFTPPGGDRAIAYVPIGHHDNSEDPAASNDDSVLYEDGTCRISVDGSKVKIKCGASSIVLSDGEIKLSSDLITALGASLKHNSKEVGDNHVHTQVMPGGGLSGVPK